MLARLLDASRHAVAVQRPEDIERAENHEGEGALLYFQLVGHGVLWESNMTVRPEPAGRNRERGPSYGFPIRKPASAGFRTARGRGAAAGPRRRRCLRSSTG